MMPSRSRLYRVGDLSQDQIGKGNHIAFMDERRLKLGSRASLHRIVPFILRFSSGRVCLVSLLDFSLP